MIFLDVEHAGFSKEFSRVGVTKRKIISNSEFVA